MQIVCKKCGYTWETTSTAKRISCSKCKTSITIMPQGVRDIVTAIPPSPPPVTTAEEEIKVIKRMEVPPQRLCLPIKLLDSIAFDRAKSWAKTNGEEYITLKVDGEGILTI